MIQVIESAQHGTRGMRASAHPNDELGANSVLTVEQAADLLHMKPRSVRELIHAGEFPASRIGRRLLILAVDLYAYIRAKCIARVMQGDHVEELACHSTDAATRLSGGSESSTVDARYRKALGLPTK